VESHLAHRLYPSRWSDCGCSDNLEPCSSHVHLQTNWCSATCARQRGRMGGRRQWSSDRGRRRVQGSGRRGGCIFIRQGAFLIVEHLLAMMVSVPPSPGRMPARGIRNMEHLLATMVRAGYGYLFLYRLLTLTRGPDTNFSELKLDSLKYYTL
jgi:hypothetical protein